MISLQLKNVNKTYKNNIKALDKFSLKVESEKIFGLIGPNGAGKTTFINIVAGILRSDSGTITVFNQNIQNNHLYKREVGFLLSRPLYPDILTATELLDFVCALYSIEKNIAKKRIIELLDFFELSNKKHEKIKNFSSGMKKKISLAAALIHHPKLLILDEPLEGIDPTSSRIIQDNLKLMVQNRTTILLTSHNLNLIENICTEVAIIHKGELILQSPTANIRNRIKSRMNNEKYSGLEELFLDMVSKGIETKYLSWINKNE